MCWGSGSGAELKGGGEGRREEGGRAGERSWGRREREGGKGLRETEAGESGERTNVGVDEALVLGVVVDVEGYGAEGGDFAGEGGEVVVVLSAGDLLGSACGRVGKGVGEVEVEEERRTVRARRLRTWLRWLVDDSGCGLDIVA